MLQCVYCKKTGEKSLFTREHVIPEAFGKFENNFTLLSEVCGECNQYFGDKLEIVLARGSYEAIARIEQELSPPESVENLIQDRIDISLSSSNEEKGLVLAFVEREGRLNVEPKPQVRFSSKSGNDFYYVTIDELNDPAFDLPSDANLSDIAILAKSDEMFEMVSESLARKGIEFVRTYDENIGDRIKGEPWIEGQVTVDRLILRAIAKICFNYLTYIHGAEFSLSKEFDSIREFIRQEDSDHAEMVSVKKNGILKYDSRAFRQTQGHLVTIDWPPMGQHIFGQLSLFNIATYQIMLSNNCKMVSPHLC